jgi:hypothetical protein
VVVVLASGGVVSLARFKTGAARKSDRPIYRAMTEAEDQLSRVCKSMVQPSPIESFDYYRPLSLTVMSPVLLRTAPSLRDALSLHKYDHDLQNKRGHHCFLQTLENQKEYSCKSWWVLLDMKQFCHYVIWETHHFKKRKEEIQDRAVRRRDEFQISSADRRRPVVQSGV